MFCLFFLLSLASAEWVEVVPVRNVKNFSVTPSPSNYEVVMKTPFPNIKVTTSTPVYETNHEATLLDDEFEVDDENIYDNQTMISSDEADIEDEAQDIPEDINIPSHGFFEFLKVIQMNLLKSVSKENKLLVLTNLRDTLLKHLYIRISNLWKKKPEKSAEARGYYKDDYEMDFPSNEGALMTIGFLTFAVFLIKLVIKLVQALKYKYNAATTTTTTAATLILLNRKKREDFNEDTARILTSIEKLPY